MLTFDIIKKTENSSSFFYFIPVHMQFCLLLETTTYNLENKAQISA